MMFKVNLLLLSAVFVAGVPSPQQGPLVYVEQGALRGTYLNSAGGRIFAAFQGIPYARPPTGKHRFKVFIPLFLFILFYVTSFDCFAGQIFFLGQLLNFRK